MILSELDIRSIEDGTVHTGDAPEGTIRLFRRTKDDITSAMTRKMPRIIERRDKKTLEICLKLKDLIEQHASKEDIMEVLFSLRFPKPFHTTIRSIFNHCMWEMKKGNYYSDVLSEERQFLESLSDNPDLSRLHGGVWSDILSMNATISSSLEDSYNEYIRYISTIIEAVIYVLSQDKGEEEGIQVNHELLADMEEWMGVIFRYQGNSYKYSMDRETTLKVPRPIFNAIICFLSVHIPENQKELVVEQKDNVLEISWKLHRNKHLPEWYDVQVQDLTNHVYIASVDGSYFLTWLVQSLPDVLSFRVENERIIFTIKPVPEV